MFPKKHQIATEVARLLDILSDCVLLIGPWLIFKALFLRFRGPFLSLALNLFYRDLFYNVSRVSPEKPEEPEKPGNFEFLDIAPADAAFAAQGHDLNEVFANSALAVMAIMAETAKVKATDNVEVDAEGYDLKSLMFDWLSKLLYVSSTENMLFSKFVVEVVEGAGKEEFKLKATCWGEKIDKKRHEMHAEVKAITYHQMEVEKKEDGKWRAQVVVDL